MTAITTEETSTLPKTVASSLRRFDGEKSAAFGERMGETLNAAALALMLSIGHRTRLLDALSQHAGGATTHELAAAAGLAERYVREWLGAMTAAGVTEYDMRTKLYRLPAEHGAWLTRAASPQNVAASMQWIGLLGSVEDEVVRAFSHGNGVPYSKYPRFHEVMAEESDQSVVAGLFDHVLPLVPGLKGRLARGIRVLDIACGAGHAMLALAERFPESRFTGYDMSYEAIGMARREAEARGLANVTFEVRDLAEMEQSEAFELVTAFDAIHDQARPAQVLENIFRALTADGVLLMQDIKASTHVHHNVGTPFGTFIYTISCMHCMSVSLANGGPGLGAAWGKEKAVEMIMAAGFSGVTVNELPHDAQNYWYIARP